MVDYKNSISDLVRFSENVDSDGDRMEIRRLAAGAVVHLNGIPVRLLGVVEFETAIGNADVAVDGWGTFSEGPEPVMRGDDPTDVFV